MVYTSSLLLISAFLLATLFLGIYRIRNVKTLREYAVGNQNFSTFTLVATVLATTFCGATLLYDLEGAHERGIYWIVSCLLLTTFSLKLLGILAVRMGPFMSNLSVSETIGQVYGPMPRLISGIASLAGSVSSLSIQLIVISNAITSCVQGVSSKQVIVVATVVLVIYSSLGGIRSVTLTDVFQLLSFSIILPLIAWFMFQKMDKPIEILSFLQSQEQYQFKNLYTFDKKWFAMVLLLITWTLDGLEPALMQRVYMARTVAQAKKVFNYSILGATVINIFTICIAIFVFIQTVDLGADHAFKYMMDNLPSNAFKGLVCIALLAMSMSSTDSELNANAVIFTNDIAMHVRALSRVNPLVIARSTSFILGFLAILLVEYETNLMKLLKLSFDFYIPIVTAPLLLAIFGFRGSSRTALTGMVSGIITVCIWNQWIEPTTEIDGALPAAMMNCLAMMISHYCLRQPDGTGWVKPDEKFEQIQQAAHRSSYRFTKKLAHLFSRQGLTEIVPNSKRVIWGISYILITTIMSLFVHGAQHAYCFPKIRLIQWNLLQLLIAAILLIYCMVVSMNNSCKKVCRANKALIGLCWLTVLLVCLPIHAVVHWKYGIFLNLNLVLSFIHCGAMLLFLPLFMALCFPITILSIGILYLSWSGQLSYVINMYDWLTIGLGSFLLIIVIHYKNEQDRDRDKIIQLECDQKQKELEEERNYCYNRYLDNITTGLSPSGDILIQVLDKIGNLYEERMDKLTEVERIAILRRHAKHWKDYFNERTHSGKYLLLRPSQTTIDELICAIEMITEIRFGYRPNILFETPKVAKIPNEPKSLKLPSKASTHLICDVPYITELLVAAIGRVIDHNHPKELPADQLVRITLYPTKIQYTTQDPKRIIDDHHFCHSAIAIVISSDATDALYIPSVKRLYLDITDIEEEELQEDQESVEPDLIKERMKAIVRAHYGHIRFKFRLPLILGPTIEDTRSQKSDVNQVENKLWPILIVLPIDIKKLHNSIAYQLPDQLILTEMQSQEIKETRNNFITFLSKYQEVKLEVIQEVLDRVEKSYGGKMHCSGVLLFIRAIHIAQIVAGQIKKEPLIFKNDPEATSETPTEIICGALLYGLPCYTSMSLTFIRANYNSNIFYLVQNIVSLDTTKSYSMHIPQFKERYHNLISQRQPCAMYIKLVERLHDLEHAIAYENKSELLVMARDTLALDVYMANNYFKLTKIASKLKSKAKEALVIAQEALKIKKHKRPIGW